MLAPPATAAANAAPEAATASVLVNRSSLWVGKLIVLSSLVTTAVRAVGPHLAAVRQRPGYAAVKKSVADELWNHGAPRAYVYVWLRLPRPERRLLAREG